MEYKVGDKVRVVANETGHFFAIDEIVRNVGDAKFEHLDGSDWWFMNKGEYEAVEVEAANLSIDIAPTTAGMNEFEDACETECTAE